MEGDESFAVVNPADESTVTELGATPLGEVNRAIAEARRTFDEGVWADRPARERAQVVHAVLDHLESVHEPLVATMVAEAGTARPLRRDGAVCRRHRPCPAIPSTCIRRLGGGGGESGPGRRARPRASGDQRPALRARRGRDGDHAVQRGDHHGLPEAHPGPAWRGTR